MNKKLLLAGMLVAGAFALPSLAGAAMTGVCSNCHTMHASQDGALPAGMTGTYGVTAYAHLLKGNGCAGCHVQGVGNDSTTGRSTTGAAIGAPQVDDSTNSLAGGYFSAGAGDSTHHNVIDAGIGGDGQLGNIPPGGSDLGAQLKCTDCHTGGGHHSNTGNDSSTWLDGTSTGASYRFLSGVQGVEDSDFGVAGGSGAANIYYGEQRAIGNDTTAGVDTISELCANCHGTFHTGAGTADTSTPPNWIRHPTDVSMPTGYQTNYGANYNPAVPVATNNTTDTTFTTTFVPAEATVICLSCHQAHGNGNADMLRFSYAANVAGDTTAATGCETCHGAK